MHVRNGTTTTAGAVEVIPTMSVKAGAMDSMPNPRAPNVRNATWSFTMPPLPPVNLDRMLSTRCTTGVRAAHDASFVLLHDCRSAAASDRGVSTARLLCHQHVIGWYLVGAVNETRSISVAGGTNLGMHAAAARLRWVVQHRQPSEVAS